MAGTNFNCPTTGKITQESSSKAAEEGRNICGIGGFSLSPTSTVNARQLGHELLKAQEVRGTMASGFAYDAGDGFKYHKDAVRGGQLSLKTLPRGAKTAIFHTRQATQGSIHFNENNHPVLSPGEQIALVHNGVIWNDNDLRRGTLAGIELADVDSAVIAPLIQNGGIKGLAELSGDVAIAWLEAEDSHILNLARVESNPIAYTWLMDGSFVFASTVRILMIALDEMNLDYGFVFEMDESVGYRVEGGVIRYAFETPKLQQIDWSGWGSGYRESVRKVTAGGNASNPGSENKPGFANVFTDEGEWEFEEFGDMPSFSDEAEEEYAKNYSTAMALLNTSEGGSILHRQPVRRAEYYTIDDGGDMKTYSTLDELETELIWYAGLGKGDQDHYSHKTKDTRWIEYFFDVGSFEMDGETRLSWIDQPEEIYNHEDPDSEGLSYIRDGVSLMVQEIGR